MRESAILRKASIEDYSGFRRMEEKAWANTGIPVISEEIFDSWLEVYPEGFVVAEIGNEICGHIFCQISDYDPTDSSDQRNWYEMTDNGTSAKTHNPNGISAFVVSISAVYPGVGRKMAFWADQFTCEQEINYLVGICRIPGLTAYAERYGIKEISSQFATEYAKKVEISTKEKLNGREKVRDPVISPFLRLPKINVGYVIENFFQDKQSENFGCVLYGAY
jgi:hypothetical protein